MNIMEGDSSHDPNDTVRTEEMENKRAQEFEQTGKVDWQSNIFPGDCDLWHIQAEVQAVSCVHSLERRLQGAMSGSEA